MGTGPAPNLKHSDPCSLESPSTTGVAERLRARVVDLTTVRGDLSALLERLHQDLAQSLTVARLGAALTSAYPASVEEDVLRSAREALLRFERLAAVWLVLSAERDRVEVPAGAFVRDLIDLLATEASILRVALRCVGDFDDSTLVRGPRIARRILVRTVAAMREAGAGARVDVALSAAGVLSWTTYAPDGSSKILRSDLRVSRP